MNITKNRLEEEQSSTTPAPNDKQLTARDLRRARAAPASARPVQHEHREKLCTQNIHNFIKTCNI
jgi:hypothetical protein